jgi:hypothetical protein
MSPIIARAVARAAGRRQFSLLPSVRGIARAIEPHPFERLPVSQKAAPGDYGKLIKNVGQRAALSVHIGRLVQLKSKLTSYIALPLPLPLFFAGPTLRTRCLMAISERLGSMRLRIMRRAIIKIPGVGLCHGLV